MSFKELSLEIAYESNQNTEEMVEDFYIPVLRQTVEYKRISGYFRSTALVIAAEGIEGLIANEGNMRLLVSPEISDKDYEIIKRFGVPTEDCDMFQDLSFGDTVDDNLKALAWMLANEKLEIRIVVPKNSRKGLFHQKIGIMTDKDGDKISFSGSINESANGWLENIEEFKVFRSWVEGQNNYLEIDERKFDQFWEGQRQQVASVYTLPDAIRDRIIRVKPHDIHDLTIMKRFKKKRKEQQLKKNTISLFPHQQEALDAWKKNNGKLLIEMATGTGKTRTAIACMNELMNIIPDHLVVIIATPQVMLTQQWVKEVHDLGIHAGVEVMAGGQNTRKYKQMEMALSSVNNGIRSNAIFYTTHATSSMERFTTIMNNHKGFNQVLYICDEVHGAGAPEQQKAMLPIYEFRIGLSATPERMYDEKGTSLIKNYFGGKSYEFSIHRALKEIRPGTDRPFLNPFYYYPIFVPLNEEEQKDYNKYTRQIIALRKKKDVDEEKIAKLAARRADIIKRAKGKEDSFKAVLKELLKEQLNEAIVFVDPSQMEFCMSTLAQNGVSRAKITEAESASKVVKGTELTERQRIVSQFSSHQIQVLLGIKCLDEGIDIPNARIAILMASSTNPREYVQRVGRVIRAKAGKPPSIIYDMIVTPEDSSESEHILQKEAVRANLIAQDAINYEEVKQLFLREGVILDVD